MSPLVEFLSRLPPGEVQDTSALEHLLAHEWHSLAGSGEGGMEGYKLVGRMERAVWQSPCLTFTIERHGGAAMGSTRAELQDWQIDIVAATATISTTRRRQLRRTARRVYVDRLAAAVAKDVINHRESPSLKRYPDGRVKILIGTIIPDQGFKQTISGRRRRFRTALEPLLSAQGWVVVATNTYKKSTST